jgi:pyruvate,water dikinase
MVSWKAARGWRLDAIHFGARAVHPLDQSLFVETLGPGSEQGFTEWSLPVARIADKAVNGWVYTRMEPAGDPPERLVRMMSKLPFLTRLWRVIPPLRKRVLGFDAFLAAGGFEAHIDTWDEVWRPEAERRVADLKRLDLATAGRGEIADQLESWRDYFMWQWSPHIRVHLICFLVRAKFARVCRRLLDMSDLDSSELLKRSDDVLLDAPRKLAEIAHAEDDAAAEKAIDAFMDAHGDVPVDGFETALPTWREQRQRLLALARQMHATGYDPDAADASFESIRRKRIEEIRGRLTANDLAEFDKWLALGERAYPLNDTHNYPLFDHPAAIVRYTALRAGDLLVDGGVIDDRSDVFFLSVPELAAALRGGGDMHALVADRRREHAHASKLEAPEFVGAQPIPATKYFPPRVAEAFTLLLDESDKMYGKATASSSTAVSGIAGSPGQAEGRVSVVTRVEELDKVIEGDVLVCPMTGPAWTVVFPIISGLITEAGGPMSHPAIVAREFGIPSVVGTGNATQVLRDGQRVRIDGAAALIEIVG